MPLSNPFRRAADRPSLRERAAALRASFRPVAPVAAPAPTASPAPGSAEAMAAFHEACRQHSIRTAPLHDCPELMRAGQDVWSTQSLGQALEAGEIGADEYARLHPLASERELRFAEITHELNIGALFALAYASEYPVPPHPKGKTDGDAELLSLVGPWEAATAAYDEAIRNQIAVSEKAGTIEAPPAREPYEEWQRLIPSWRERTGVTAAEDVSREAAEVVDEIEDRIAALPATTMPGLRLKVRVAQRSDDIESVWPDGLSEGLVRDILAMDETVIEADADLLRLGRLFEAASERTVAACEACNAAGREADRLMPMRPAALTLRESDHPLRIYREVTYPTALQGIDLSPGDVEWLRRRMPMMHEVLRPIRGGERAHVDHPGRRFEIVPHPEAQARAEEIITAWDAWRAEINRIHRVHVTSDLEHAADAAAEATDALVGQIANLPAHTADGFRVKLRALCYYQRETLVSDLPDQPDPDQMLSHSIWRDMQGEAKPVEPSSDLLIPAILDGWAAWALVLSSTDDTENTTAWEQADADRDRLLYAAMALPAMPENIAAKALACAWMEWVSVERPGQPRNDYSPADQLVFDINATIMGRGVQRLDTGSPWSGELPLSALVPMVDFAGASMEELRAIREAADMVCAVASAATWQGCNRRRNHPSGAAIHNQAGDLMRWVSDALGFVVTAAEAEARRRSPESSDEQKTRLFLLAGSVIDNDDHAETAAFARDLVATVQP